MSVQRLSRNPDLVPCELIVDGYAVPYIEVLEHPDGHFSLTLMRPGCSPLFGMDIETEDELGRWAPMLAQAMAVSAGRTSHGENSRPHNPHGSNQIAVAEPVIPTAVEEIAAS